MRRVRARLFVFLVTMLLAMTGAASAGGTQEGSQAEGTALQGLFAVSACPQITASLSATFCSQRISGGLLGPV